MVRNIYIRNRVQIEQQWFGEGRIFEPEKKRMC